MGTGVCGGQRSDYLFVYQVTEACLYSINMDSNVDKRVLVVFTSNTPRLCGAFTVPQTQTTKMRKSAFIC